MHGNDIHEAIRVEKQRHFVGAMSKAIDGRPVTQSDCALLETIFEALLRGKDVSSLIGVGRPMPAVPTTRSISHSTTCASRN